MAKQGGLGMACYVDGNDVSGDIGSISTISTPMKPLDVTSVADMAMERIGGPRDASIGYTAYFNPVGAHPVFSALPTADRGFMVCIGTAVGSPAACMVAKQLNYDPTRGTDGSLTEKITASSDGFALDWGKLITGAGSSIRVDTAATNGTGVDDGAGFATPAVPSSTTPVTNTSQLPATVIISGGTLTNVAVNGVTVGSGDGTYTVPAGGTIAITYSVAPTWTWTLATSFGLQAYLHVTAFTGTDVTMKLQDSADNATWTDLAGAAFTQVTAANQAQRLALSNTATVRRYLRASTVTTGGFTSVSFALAYNRNLAAGVAF